jgi:hypothetical protein
MGIPSLYPESSIQSRGTIILREINRKRNGIDAFFDKFRRNIYLVRREKGDAGTYSGFGYQNTGESASITKIKA